MKLEAEMEKVVALAKRVEQLDVEVSQNPQYLNKVRRCQTSVLCRVPSSYVFLPQVSKGGGAASNTSMDLAEEIAIQESLGMGAANYSGMA